MAEIKSHSIDSPGNKHTSTVSDEDHMEVIKRLDDIDSHSCITFEPNFEDEDADQTAMSNFTYFYACSSMM